MTKYLEKMKIGDKIDMKGPGGKLNYFGNGNFRITKKPALGNINRK